MKVRSNSLTRRHTAQTVAVIAMTGGLSWLVGVAWVMYRHTRVNPPKNMLVMPALILGCRPGPGLERRVHAGVELYRRGLMTTLVVSGYNEAQFACDAAVKQGIPKHRIIMEHQARSTMENLMLSRESLTETPFWLVTDRWHMPRVMWACKDLAMRPSPYPVEHQSPPHIRARIIAREGLSVVHYWTGRRLLKRPNTAY